MESLSRLAINELREFYIAVSNSYDQLRIKALAMIAGEVAIITFIFSGKFPLPKVVYGIVFFSIALLLISISFLSFLWIISPVRWEHPTDVDALRKVDKNFKNRETFLEQLVQDHHNAIDICSRILTRKAKAFVWAIYLLSIGIFILLMIKFGAGKV